MKTYTYILFDWDGCLARTLDIWLGAYKHVFAEYDLYPDDHVITHQVFGDWNGPKKVGVSDIDEFTHKLLAKVDEEYPQVKLNDNAFEVVETLKSNNKKLALITTSKRSTIQPALENTKLTSMFEVILTAEDVEKHKPDPEIVDKALEILGGSKSEAIIIGDSKSDLGAARNAAIDSILYFPLHNQIFYDQDLLMSFDPTYTVSDFKEVLDILGISKTYL